MDSTPGIERKTASHWLSEDEAVRCALCPRRCRIVRGMAGSCGVRENIDGKLIATTYGENAVLALDPIEKKPLYHFHPGASILSVGAFGCNFSCEFCQNWQLVHERPPLKKVRIDDLIASARQTGSIGIAYTYNEPLIQFEFVMDCSKAFRAAGMKNVLVTNGSILQEPLMELLPFTDAMNIDLKSMEPEFYRKTCHGDLAPVLETIRAAAGKTHVEVTTLLYTDHNDSDAHIRKVIDFIAETDPEIPLHFSRYFPRFQATAPPTPVDRLEAAWRAAREWLPYVYMGNAHFPEAADTICPNCRSTVVSRESYRADLSGLSGNRCASCEKILRFVTYP
ncbi:MAG: AmmeMemoRadiSam system radical SAM enzyme [Syntrophorhabdaceae bacterium]|nr:AmmeMemoRadiSam system radical SAM enzyme [Syntrophorhabdaceae bacterium]